MKKGVFSSLRNFNDSIIPYYAYMGSSFAYINATEQQQQQKKKRQRVEDSHEFSQPLRFIV
jgi:hypothetical protein